LNHEKEFILDLASAERLPGLSSSETGGLRLLNMERRTWI
jgi:hypothetical protein